MPTSLTQDQLNNTYLDLETQNGAYASQIVGATGQKTNDVALSARYTSMTSDDSYLALLQGLQSTVIALEQRKNLDQVHLFEIDLNTRSIYPAPEFQAFIGVVGEHKSETITFQVDRYYDGVDLARMMIVIEYVNANGEGRVSPIIMRDYTTFPDKIIFDWIVDSGMTMSAGIVEFDVRFYMIGDVDASGNAPLVYSLRTLPYKTQVVATLPIDMEKMELEYQSQFADTLEAIIASNQQVINRLNDIHVYWNDIT